MALYESGLISGEGYTAPSDPFLELDFNIASFMPSLSVGTSSTKTQWFLLFIDDSTKNKRIRFVNSTSVLCTFTYKMFDANGTQTQQSYTSSKDNSSSSVGIPDGTRYIVGKLSSSSGSASCTLTLV